MKKLFFIFLGSCTFALGTLGIFLPLLPTTGFYLLTAFFWMRSSDKLYKNISKKPSLRKKLLVKANGNYLFPCFFYLPFRV